MLRNGLSAYGRCWKAQAESLPALMLARACLLAAALFAAKWLAVRHALSDSGLSVRLDSFLRVIPHDVVTVGVVALMALVGLYCPTLPKRLRWPCVIVLDLLFLAWMIAGFANVEFYASLGTPLEYHLLLLAPKVSKHLLLSGLTDRAGGLIAIGACLVMYPLVAPTLAARFAPRMASQPKRHWAGAAAVLVAGGALSLLPAEKVQVSAMRRMNVFQMIFPGRIERAADLAPPSAFEKELLSKLCGAPRSEGEAAFSALPRKKLNVILFVWESVGLRYLKSRHPLGVAKTPYLDRILAAGNVSFDACYVESPLTVQSGWAIVTGMSPPARPIIFTYDEKLPKHGVMLPKALKELGYRTSHFNASKLDAWKFDRFFPMAGFDVMEDYHQLKKRPGVREHGWGVEDSVMLTRTLEWIDEDRETPFFTLLWNIETHHPYEWVDMPKEFKKKDDLFKFARTVERSDKLFGQLHDALRTRGLLDETLIIIVGDHGQGLGRPPRPWDRAHSMLVYEDTLHIPLFFVHPALKEQAKRPVDFVCTLTDLFPTVMDLVGGRPPNGLDGNSLARPYPAKPFYGRSIIWWPVCIRAGHYKLILDRAGVAPALFDIEKDPTEARDISQQRPEIANVLHADLIRWSAERFENDPSFTYGFTIIPMSSDDGTPKGRPTVRDLLKKEDK